MTKNKAPTMGEPIGDIKFCNRCRKETTDCTCRPLFDVLIIETKTNKVVSVTGKSLDARQADRRELTTLSRVNIGDYFVTQAAAGKFEKDARFEP